MLISSLVGFTGTLIGFGLLGLGVRMFVKLMESGKRPAPGLVLAIVLKIPLIGGLLLYFRTLGPGEQQAFGYGMVLAFTVFIFFLVWSSNRTSPEV